jgi:hypothetical protein
MQWQNSSSRTAARARSETSTNASLGQYKRGEARRGGQGQPGRGGRRRHGQRLDTYSCCDVLLVRRTGAVRPGRIRTRAGILLSAIDTWCASATEAGEVRAHGEV